MFLNLPFSHFRLYLSKDSNTSRSSTVRGILHRHGPNDFSSTPSINNLHFSSSWKLCSTTYSNFSSSKYLFGSHLSFRFSVHAFESPFFPLLVLRYFLPVTLPSSFISTYCSRSSSSGNVPVPSRSRYSLTSQPPSAGSEVTVLRGFVLSSRPLFARRV